MEAVVWKLGATAVMHETFSALVNDDAGRGTLAGRVETNNSG